jgi:hypothetical protein
MASAPNISAVAANVFAREPSGVGHLPYTR